MTEKKLTDKELNDSIMQLLDEKHHPKKYGLKRKLNKAAETLDKVADKIDSIGREVNENRVAYDPSTPYEKLTPEQQVSATVDTLIEKRHKKQHPVSARVAEFTRNLARTFESGAAKIKYYENEKTSLLGKVKKGKGR